MIKKGDRFRCIENIIMDIGGVIAYKKNTVYTSNADGCITDEQDNINHGISEKYLSEYFTKVDEKGLELTHWGGLDNEKHLEKGIKKDSDKLPYFTVLFEQFPLALREVIKCSKAGHSKYRETDQDMQNFSRVKNSERRYKDAMLRHMTETGIVEDMAEYGEMTHEGAVVWNALADLEIKLRKK